VLRPLTPALVLAAACALPDEPVDGAHDAFLADGKADVSTFTAAEGAAVLDLANTASLSVLDVDVGLDVRAARGIVDRRPLADLAALDAVPYVGPVAFDRLLAYAYAHDRVEDGAAAPVCLRISEYVEGWGTYNKAIEVWNCGDAAVDLARVSLCLVRDAAVDCSVTGTLGAGGALGPGAVVTVCRRDATAFNDPTPAIVAACTVELPGVMTFSGNDRLVLFEDADGDGKLGAVESIHDAFGWIARAPSTELWSDMTLRRCSPARFDGGGFFPYLDYFTVHARGDHAHLGVPPDANGCR
jgi:hypothetical protein